jgi:hypothetical protein
LFSVRSLALTVLPTAVDSAVAAEVRLTETGAEPTAAATVVIAPVVC